MKYAVNEKYDQCEPFDVDAEDAISLESALYCRADTLMHDDFEVSNVEFEAVSEAWEISRFEFTREESWYCTGGRTS